ncbi:unnamed protein product [Alopecurus aequalis]
MDPSCVVPMGSVDQAAEELPSIFRPRRQVCVAAASSRGSATGGNVIVAAIGPYHKHPSSESSPPLITQNMKRDIVEFLVRLESGLDKAAFLAWAGGNVTDARARGCYEADDSLRRTCTCPMAGRDLADMHLYDGCLVLFAIFVFSVRKDPLPAELARTTNLGKEFINLSSVISYHMKETKLDLLLLGNQIPFFVLQRLHTQLKGTILFRDNNRTIEQLALSCFDDIHPSPSRPTLPLSLPTVVHHLLHLFHSSRVGRGRHDSPPLLGEPESKLDCATWYQESLIGFSTHAAAPGTLHMEFRRSMLGARGALCVPPLQIHGYSALVFHNLIAFEQRYPRCGLGATTYCFCMARLLQSEADVKLLRRSGILAHTHETDEEIVKLFKDLREEYRHASYSRDLIDLCKNVEAHEHSRVARAAKSVVLQCFPRQTMTFFVILGAIISLATLVNTGYAVYRFYHPVKQ